MEYPMSIPAPWWSWPWSSSSFVALIFCTHVTADSSPAANLGFWGPQFGMRGDCKIEENHWKSHGTSSFLEEFGTSHGISSFLEELILSTNNISDLWGVSIVPRPEGEYTILGIWWFDVTHQEIQPISTFCFMYFIPQQKWYGSRLDVVDCKGLWLLEMLRFSSLCVWLTHAYKINLMPLSSWQNLDTPIYCDGKDQTSSNH